MAQLNMANLTQLASAQAGVGAAQPPSTPGALGSLQNPIMPFGQQSLTLSASTNPGLGSFSNTNPLQGLQLPGTGTQALQTDNAATNAALQESIQASLATLQSSIANLQAMSGASQPLTPNLGLQGVQSLSTAAPTFDLSALQSSLTNASLTAGATSSDPTAAFLQSFGLGTSSSSISPSLLASPFSSSSFGSFGGLGATDFGLGLSGFGGLPGADFSSSFTGGFATNSSLFSPQLSNTNSGFYFPTSPQIGAPPVANQPPVATEKEPEPEPAPVPQEQQLERPPPLLTKDGRIGIDVKANATRLLGHTPMVFLNRITESCRGQIACKLEYVSAFGGGDRAAWALVDGAERDHTLIPQRSILVCATTGNVGVGVAAIGAVRGYKVIITMPENMALETRCLLRAYGAEVVLTPASKGVKGAVAKAEQIVRATPHAINLCQFSSVDTVYIHRTTTGPEIYCDTHGLVDVFVCGVGSGATLTGVAQFLKQQESKCKIVAVEPAECSLLSGGKPGQHRIQGLGVGFESEALDPDLVDEIFTVRSEQAFEMARQLPRKEGLLVGPSAGAVVFAAVEIAKRPEMDGKLIVCVLQCGGERYLSSPVFEEVRRECLTMTILPDSEGFRFRREER